MICYKDQTFCMDWCANEECDKNFCHIEEAREVGGFLHNNPNFPICFFVDVPTTCKEYISNEPEAA